MLLVSLVLGGSTEQPPDGKILLVIVSLVSPAFSVIYRPVEYSVGGQNRRGHNQGDT